MIVAGLLPLAWIYRSRILLSLGTLVRRKGDFSASGPILSFSGYLVYLIPLFVLSFFHRGSGLFTVEFGNLLAGIYFFTFAAAAVGLSIWSYWPALHLKIYDRTNFHIVHCGVLATLFVVVLNSLGILGLKGWAGAAFFDLVFLFHGIILIAAGCKQLDLKSTTLGCLMLAFISLARYTDLFVSLIARSAVFLIMGASLFAVGFYYSRSKKQLQEQAK